MVASGIVTPVAEELALPAMRHFGKERSAEMCEGIGSQLENSNRWVGGYWFYGNVKSRNPWNAD